METTIECAIECVSAARTAECIAVRKGSVERGTSHNLWSLP